MVTPTGPAGDAAPDAEGTGPVDEGTGPVDEGTDPDGAGSEGAGPEGAGPEGAGPEADGRDGGAARRAEPPDTGEGDVLARANTGATAVFTVVAAVAAAFPDTFVRVFVPVSLVLFAAGCVAFVWAFAVAVGRSRFEAVDMGGLFFLGGGAAPARVRRAFQLALAVQVVVAVAAAVARPFTPLAFGALAPMLGVGLMALWGARHAAFPPRDDER